MPESDDEKIISAGIAGMPPINFQRSTKGRFMAACSEWADLIIAESVTQKASGGERWKFTPEDVIPKVAYGDIALIAAGENDALNELQRIAGDCGSDDISSAIFAARRLLINCSLAKGSLQVEELPEAQRAVWLASWQLMMDSWDEAPSDEMAAFR